MTSRSRILYSYIGPKEIKDSISSGAAGCAISAVEDLVSWITSRPLDERSQPFTYTVGEDEVFRIAPRRSEHVACAGGREVLAAGEISFELTSNPVTVSDVSNHSTGFCPDLVSWQPLEDCLRRIGVRCPPHFTESQIFRKCPICRERNLVKEAHFYCVFCGGSLPRHWNFGDV